MSLTILIPLVVFAALILINGIFVASEFAAVAARQSRLETRADSGNRSARWIVSLFAQPMGKDRYIAIAQLGVTLASIGLGMYGEPTIADWLHGPFVRWGLSAAAAHTVAFIVALSAVTYMHVVFGEMIPKALALQDPERMIEKVNPAMRAFGLAFRPMVWAVNMAALGSCGRFGYPSQTTSCRCTPAQSWQSSLMRRLIVANSEPSNETSSRTSSTSMKPPLRSS
jgi:CBS domain containing-hemolysin-like protein